MFEGLKKKFRSVLAFTIHFLKRSVLLCWELFIKARPSHHHLIRAYKSKKIKKADGEFHLIQYKRKGRILPFIFVFLDETKNFNLFSNVQLNSLTLKYILCKVSMIQPFCYIVYKKGNFKRTILVGFFDQVCCC